MSEGREREREMMAFIDVEWELPNGTTAVTWTGREEVATETWNLFVFSL